ncbi:MAG: 7-carboxy-7-deazaguanine synthase [Syntrophorhabdus sp.]
MAYFIKEIFYSLQGEGINTGRPAVFVRFSGCNLWSGRPEDRTKIPCPFCDTDFVGTDGPLGGQYRTVRDIIPAMESCLPAAQKRGDTPRFTVLTGGEPALQADKDLIDGLHAQNWEIAIETNGTCPIPDNIDWITVSPKAGCRLVVTSGNELKLLFPQATDPASFEALQYSHFIIQPIHDASYRENERLAIQYCLDHPRWRFGIQLHKILGIK